jgi:hypothetical protein
LVRFVLFVVEHQVAVVRNAVQYIDDAGAAQALLAAAVHVVAVFQQHVEDRLVGRDGVNLAAAGDLHLEGRVGLVADRRVGREIFEVDGARGPVLRGFLDGVHEAGGPAAVEVGAVFHLGQQRLDVEAVRGVAAVVVEDDMAAELRRSELGHEGGLLWRAGAVMQRVVGTARGQVVHHGQHGRDSDAAGDQQVAPGALG